MRKYLYIYIALLISLPSLSMGQGALSVSITGYDARCNGSSTGSATVAASGGTAPYFYVWAPAVGTSDSVGGLAPGTYTVTVIDHHGTTASSSVTISEPAPLTVSIDSIVVIPCFRTTTGGACGCSNTLWAVVSGGSAPYSYLWTPSGCTSDTLAGACYIEFSVNVTDNNGCISGDSILVVAPSIISDSGVTGVAEVNDATGISVFPNPATNEVNVGIAQPAGHAAKLEVLNMLGGLALSQELNGSEKLITLDVSKLAAGNYLVRISGSESQKAGYFSVVK